jgi:catechol 2,3-dioxygenase-like lactoylglutathione lyase family enzyme
MSKSVKLHHVALRVSSLDRSLSFYGCIFGLECSKRLQIKDGGEIVHLCCPNTPGGGVIELICDGQVPECTDDFHLCFRVENVYSFLTATAGPEVRVVSEPTVIGKETVAFISDPDGYLIELNDHP